MDSTCRTKTVQALCKQIDKGTISFKHDLQRPEDQWNNKMKSDLIDSLLRKMPVNPSYGEKKDGVISIIDGIQRLSTINNYVNDRFTLNKSCKPVIINGEEKEIAGKRFKKLDEDTQDALLNAELQVYELTDCTPVDIVEIFRRQNAGKPLSSKLLRVVIETPEFRKLIYEMIDHPFIKKITTPAQHKSGSDRDLIIQTFMLLMSESGREFTSFRTNDINMFIAEHQVDTMKYSGILKDALDKLDSTFADKIKVPITTAPMILWGGCKIVMNHKNFSKYIDAVKAFIENPAPTDDYKKSTEGGTSSSDNVMIRFAYWKGIVKGC